MRQISEPDREGKLIFNGNARRQMLLCSTSLSSSTSIYKSGVDQRHLAAMTGVVSASVDLVFAVALLYKKEILEPYP